VKRKMMMIMVIVLVLAIFAGCDEMTPEEIIVVERLAEDNEDVARLVDEYNEGNSQDELPKSDVHQFGQGPKIGDQGGMPERRPEMGEQGGMPQRRPEMGDQDEMQQGSTGAERDSSLTLYEANLMEESLVQDTSGLALVDTYAINDTGITVSYDDRDTISLPGINDEFYGQDSNYTTNEMSFTENGDGTVTDNNTGLVWLQIADEKMIWEEAVAYAREYEMAEQEGWRLPTIKELYSLIDFSGNTTDTPYIDTDYFEFHWGDETGERQIDSQYATSTIYETTTMNGNVTMFGVNFADGRIKGYPISKDFYVMLVKDGDGYGVNNFVDNGDGTISDLATGLMWMEFDSVNLLDDDGFMDWETALEWAENLEYAGYDDWKLPDAKELQSIVDYERSPDTTDSAAIDPMFDATEIINLLGETDYGYYWTSTTHAENDHGDKGVYVAFGRCIGQISDEIMDVHGAGSQRSDPKSGDASDYPSIGNGPQGDESRVYNMVRLVREIDE